MLLSKLETNRADELASTLANINPRSAITGYLVGLLQDVAHCIEVNLKNDPANDNGDVRLINDIIKTLGSVEGDLSALLTTAIRAGKEKGKVSE